MLGRFLNLHVTKMLKIMKKFLDFRHLFHKFVGLIELSPGWMSTAVTPDPAMQRYSGQDGFFREKIQTTPFNEELSCW